MEGAERTRRYPEKLSKLLDGPETDPASTSEHHDEPPRNVGVSGLCGLYLRNRETPSQSGPDRINEPPCGIARLGRKEESEAVGKN
jgi:hypothetical protein